MKKRCVEHIAEVYSHHSEKYACILEPTLQPMADEIIRIGKLQKGQRVLDLATGSGLIARAIASTGNAVTGVDISYESLKTAQNASMRQIPFITADAHALPFADCRFDHVTCGLSLSHFLRVPVALCEVRRVLCYGGLFLASAWNTEKKDPLFSAVFETIEKHLEDKDIQPERPFGEKTWGDVECGCEILRQAGFEDVQVTTLPLSFVFRSPKDAIKWAMAWPSVRERLSNLDSSDQERARNDALSTVIDIRELSWSRDIHYYQAKKMCFSSAKSLLE